MIRAKQNLLKSCHLPFLAATQHYILLNKLTVFKSISQVFNADQRYSFPHGLCIHSLPQTIIWY